MRLTAADQELIRDRLVIAGSSGLAPRDLWPDLGDRSRENRAATIKAKGLMFGAGSGAGIRYFATQELADAAKKQMEEAAAAAMRARKKVYRLRGKANREPAAKRVTYSARIVEALKEAGGKGMTSAEIVSLLDRPREAVAEFISKARKDGDLFSRPDPNGRAKNALRYFAAGVVPDAAVIALPKPAAPKKALPALTGPVIIPRGLKTVYCPHSEDHRHTVQPHEVQPFFSKLGVGRYL